MKVAIAGGGIGGLTAALILHDAGIEVTVFEAVREPAPLGVGINILPHAVAELDKLGILEELLPLGVPTAELCYANRHGQFIWREPRGSAAGLSRARSSRFTADSCSSRCSTSPAADSVMTRFEPGARSPTSTNRRRAGMFSWTSLDRRRETVVCEDADVLVGADGIHSTVRALLYPDEGPPRWSGEILWRATTTAAAVPLGPFHGHDRIAAAQGRRLSDLAERTPMAMRSINWIAVLDRSTAAAAASEDWNRLGRARRLHRTLRGLVVRLARRPRTAAGRGGHLRVPDGRPRPAAAMEPSVA